MTSLQRIFYKVCKVKGFLVPKNFASKDLQKKNCAILTSMNRGGYLDPLYTLFANFSISAKLQSCKVANFRTIFDQVVKVNYYE